MGINTSISLLPAAFSSAPVKLSQRTKGSECYSHRMSALWNPGQGREGWRVELEVQPKRYHLSDDRVWGEEAEWRVWGDSRASGPYNSEITKIVMNDFKKLIQR